VIKFFKAYDDVPDPKAALDNLSGEIPLRAYQHCEPFLAANRIGYLLYPPIDFSLVWNGAEIYVQIDGVDELLILDKLFLPDFADDWIENAPADLVETMPVFLEAFPERGMIQAWTGFYICTDEGVSTWVRGPVNRPQSAAYSIVEGIVETDWWMGMLFTNIQLQRTDEPIHFKRSTPWLQALPIPSELHSKKRSIEADVTSGLANFPADTWDAIKATSDRRNSGRPGSYRAESRRRRQEGASSYE
jgi:hypothetical protein